MGEICAVVGKRLNEIDCLRKGWVLDGFPKTRSQAEFLRQSHFWPTRLIQFLMTEDAGLMRIATRQIDPITGTAYYRPPNSVAVRQRLMQAEYDKPGKVRERYQIFADNIDRVVQTFAQVASHVNGDDEIALVSKALSEKID